MEQIQIQIEAALVRLRLAKPDFGLWSGPAASTLAQTLHSVEAELNYLRHRLGH